MNNTNRSRRTSVLRKRSTMTLGMWSAMVILGLVGIQEARPQSSTTGTFISAGGTVAIGKFKLAGTLKCPDQKPVGPFVTDEQEDDWDDCQDSMLYILGPTMSLPPQPLIHPAPPRIAQASGTSTLTLSSSTPYLPLLGSQLVVSSYVPNATGAGNATAAYKVGLRRQADCSLVEDFILPSATTPNAALITSLPAAQDYFHQLSGLTTTPDVFANGCNYPLLGLPSTVNILLLGTTAAGGVISTGLTNNGALQVSVTDVVANTFKTTTLSTGVNGAFSAADLNGDGIIDIVATFVTDPATRKQSTAVYLGNGDGAFKPGVYYDVPGDITIDDINGDGKPDIVVITSPGVTTLIGKGDGTFTIGPASAIGAFAPVGPFSETNLIFAQAAGKVLTGDFNGDGKKDLLAGGIVLLGAGDGTFTAGLPITTDPSFNFLSGIAITAAGDLNNDGKLDLVVSQPGFVATFYGNGNGTFRAGPRYAALPDYEQVTITDIDGDGNPDIVLGTSTGGIYTDGGVDIEPPLLQILLGRGDGTFVDSVVYNQGTYGGPVNSGNSGPEIASADFNGDGKPDVLVFNQSNDGGAPSSLVVLPGDGTGNLGTAIPSSINLTPVMVVAADMNHDGKPDAVLAGNGFRANPLLSVLINQGNGKFAGEQDYPLPNGVVSLAVGDFNGDGRMDVAVGVAAGLGGSGPSGVYVLLGQANGSLGTPVKLDASLSPTGLAAGDLNGDGRTDLVVADQGFFNFAGGSRQVNGALHVYLGNSDGTFTAAGALSTSATNYTVAALGDLNNDGKLDLILGGNVAGTSIGAGTPNVYTLLGNGDGTFQASNTQPLAGADGIGATSIALADFNKDGGLDLAVGNPNDFIEVFLGNGDGTLTHTILALGQRPGTVAAADLNGDGFPEIFVGQGNNLAVFLNANAWTPPR